MEVKAVCLETSWMIGGCVRGRLRDVVDMLMLGPYGQDGRKR